MAKRISELPAASSIADTDELELNQSATSRKATRAQLVSGLAEADHGHSLADITDSGLLAGRDSVGSSDIEAGAVTATELADDAVTPAKLDRAYAEAGHGHADATAGQSGFLSAADKAKLDGIEPEAKADQSAADVPFTPAGNLAATTAQAALEELDAEKAANAHTHGLADITDSGGLASKDTVATADIADGAVSAAKLAPGTPDTLLGFDGSGAAAEITPGQGIDVAGAVIAADVASVFGRTGTVTAESGDYDGLPLNLQDAPLTRPEIRDYSETSNTPTIAGGALTLDLEAGNVFDVVLTEDVTSISVVNAPASGRLGTVTIRFRQDAVGGRTLDLSGFDFGSAPTPAMPGTATTGRLWITALTLDGGATWEAVAGFEKT